MTYVLYKIMPTLSTWILILLTCQLPVQGKPSSEPDPTIRTRRNGYHQTQATPGAIFINNVNPTSQSVASAQSFAQSSENSALPVSSPTTATFMDSASITNDQAHANSGILVSPIPTPLVHRPAVRFGFDVVPFPRGPYDAPNCGCVLRGSCSGEAGLYTRQVIHRSDLVCGLKLDKCCYDGPWSGVKDDFAQVCACIPEEQCARPYGILPTDVRDFGVIKPCPGHGAVRCLLVDSAGLLEFKTAMASIEVPQNQHVTLSDSAQVTPTHIETPIQQNNIQSSANSVAVSSAKADAINGGIYYGPSITTFGNSAAAFSSANSGSFVHSNGGGHYVDNPLLTRVPVSVSNANAASPTHIEIPIHQNNIQSSTNSVAVSSANADAINGGIYYSPPVAAFRNSAAAVSSANSGSFVNNGGGHYYVGNPLLTHIPVSANPNAGAFPSHFEVPIQQNNIQSSANSVAVSSAKADAINGGIYYSPPVAAFGNSAAAVSSANSGSFVNNNGGGQYYVGNPLLTHIPVFANPNAGAFPSHFEAPIQQNNIQSSANSVAVSSAKADAINGGIYNSPPVTTFGNSAAAVSSANSGSFVSNNGGRQYYVGNPSLTNIPVSANPNAGALQSHVEIPIEQNSIQSSDDSVAVSSAGNADVINDGTYNSPPVTTFGGSAATAISSSNPGSFLNSNYRHQAYHPYFFAKKKLSINIMKG